MITRILKLVIFIPVAIVLIVLSVANRHVVTLALNPFRPEDNLLSLSLPFFVFLFLALLIGVVVGSFATWLTQGRYRKRARDEAQEARKWRDEAGRQRNQLEQATTQKLISASK
jgi:NADH:ubiquinone oxidoreductase subunit 3 (subunit A)